MKQITYGKLLLDFKTKQQKDVKEIGDRFVLLYFFFSLYFIKNKLKKLQKLQIVMSTSDTGLCTLPKMFWSGTHSIEQGKFSNYGGMECQFR